MARILIVDDSENFRTSLTIGLRREGFEVGMSGEALEAIQELAHHQYDVMLIDLKMPRINGIELSALAKKINPRMLIVLVSAYDFTEYEVQYPEMGSYPRLTKPFELQELFNLLNLKAQSDFSTGISVRLIVQVLPQLFVCGRFRAQEEKVNKVN